MKKRLIYIFVILLISLVVISACEEIKARRINFGQDNCRRDLSRCGTQEECGNDYPCLFVCNEPFPGGRFGWTEYPCEFGCINGRCAEPPQQECLPLIENHNNLNQNRINMVFVGSNYENVSEFKNKVLEILNVNGGSPGFFAEAPFRGNQNKFNFWYVNEIRDYDEENYLEDLQELLSKCDILNLNNKQEIRFIRKSVRRSYAESGRGFYLFGGGTLRINTFLHEFGHSFGWLADEYLYRTSGWYISELIYKYLNVNIPNKEQACENWCEGESVPLEEFENFNCSNFTNQTDCDQNIEEGVRLENNKPCIWIENSMCKNIFHLCSSSNNEETCNSFKNAYGGDLCAFNEENIRNIIKHPYFNSSCIPTNFYGLNTIGHENIGTQCIENTGCYQGASWVSHFRSTLTSKMRASSQPWGYVNERILREKLAQFGRGRRLMRRDEGEEEIPYIITYDEFDKEGKIVNGGMVCLDCMEEEDRNNLLRNVNQRTNIYDNNGNLDYSKINPSVLIDEYKKLNEKNIQAIDKN